jgi:hypothetical protein
VKCCGDGKENDPASCPPHLHMSDGENIQLKWINSPEALKIWQALNVRHGKYCASCSATQQWLDIGPVFLVLHKLMKGVKSLEVPEERFIEEDYKKGVQETGVKFNTKDKATLLPFLQSFPQLFQQAASPHNIQKGCVQSGQVSEHNSKPNFDQMAQQCPGARVTMVCARVCTCVCVCVCAAHRAAHVRICVCVSCDVCVCECVCSNCLFMCAMCRVRAAVKSRQVACAQATAIG